MLYYTNLQQPAFSILRAAPISFPCPTHVIGAGGVEDQNGSWLVEIVPEFSIFNIHCINSKVINGSNEIIPTVLTKDLDFISDSYKSPYCIDQCRWWHFLYGLYMDCSSCKAWIHNRPSLRLSTSTSGSGRDVPGSKYIDVNITEKTDLVPVYQEVDLRGLRHWIHLCTCSAIRRLAPVTRNPAEHKVPSVICRPWWCWISSCTWLMRSLAIWCFPGMSRGCFSGNGMLAYFSLLPMLNRWSESRKGSRDRLWLLFGSGKFCSRYFQSVCLSLDRTYYILLCL